MAKKRKKTKKPNFPAKTKSQNYSLAKIKVIGIGGAGGNAVSRMASGFPRGVELIALNTDIQDLNHTNARKKIQIGKNVTKGLGTGMNPDLGRQAAEESRSDIANILEGADMVFITAGFGGGSGTGISPIVAEIAREMGIMTIAVVTKPFGFEGAKRNQIAEEGLIKIRDRVDTLITIPNDRIFSLIEKDTSLIKAFEAIDEVLKNSVLGITEIIATPGIINIDFADVKTIIRDGGPAIIGIGIASGNERSLTAANLAMNPPLLEMNIEGAKGILFTISGRRDLKMNEVNEIAKLISENVDPSARIIFGTHHDWKLKKGQIKITLIATGFNNHFSKNNILFPGFFSATSTKKISDFQKEETEISENQTVLSQKNEFNVAPKQEEIKVFKEATLFEKKTESESKTSKEKRDDIWEIPAFLRKKKKRNR